MEAVRSLHDLRCRAQNDEQYRKLAMVAAENLGGGPRELRDLDSAVEWLSMNAMETDEEGVVEEINFCREFVS